MDSFPPVPGAQVTLANWRTAPFNSWAFHHVREIIPTAEIANNPASVQNLETAPEDLAKFTFADGRGRRWGFADFLRASNTDGLVILKNGRIIHESYANGMTAGTPHILMSVSKSMLGLLTGILVEQDILAVDRSVADILPEVSGTTYRDATLRHLLDMRAGVAFDEDYLATDGTIIAYRKATNWNPLAPDETETDLRAFYRYLTDSDGQHGRGFHYVSPNTDLLGWVIERASGYRYADLMAQLLWEPLGATRSAYITVDRLGAPRAAGGMCATARDLALVGQLLLEDGTRDSKQVVPSAWIADIAGNGNAAAWNAGSFAPYFPGRAMHYRSKWYVDNEAGPMLFGLGVHGQNLFVDPASDLVVAKFSSQELPLDSDLIGLTTHFVDTLRWNL